MPAASTGSKQPRTSRQPGPKKKCQRQLLGGFTIGSIIYTVDLHGPPGSVSEEQVQTIASAFYERLTAS
jgi:hypothetical protein